jgi:hypothetical protein
LILVAEKSQSKYLGSLCYFENPLSNPLQRPYSGDFDPESWRDSEKSHQKRPVRSKKYGAFLLHSMRDEHYSREH